MTGPIRYTPLYYWIESQAATIASLRQQLQERERLLAESQAREKKRVELMDKQYWMDAQSIPQDSTALDEALAKAKLEGGKQALLEAANLVDNMVRLRFHIRDIAGDVRRMAEEMK